jgi:hypothetical protein
MIPDAAVQVSLVLLLFCFGEGGSEIVALWYPVLDSLVLGMVATYLPRLVSLDNTKWRKSRETVCYTSSALSPALFEVFRSTSKVAPISHISTKLHYVL